MAGLFEEYGIDPDEIPDGPNYDVPDGVYLFEIGRVFEWESEDEERRSLVIEYLLDDEEGTTGSKSEWFTTPFDPDSPSEREVQGLGFLKQRLLSLGVPREQLGTVEGEQLVGITGTLTLATTVSKRGKSKGKPFQNVRNVRVEEAEEAPEVPEKKVAAPKAKVALGKTTTAKANPFAKAAK